MPLRIGKEIQEMLWSVIDIATEIDSAINVGDALVPGSDIRFLGL